MPGKTGSDGTNGDLILMTAKNSNIECELQETNVTTSGFFSPSPTDSYSHYIESIVETIEDPIQKNILRVTLNELFKNMTTAVELIKGLTLEFKPQDILKILVDKSATFSPAEFEEFT
jgi:hypothetical protein